MATRPEQQHNDVRRFEQTQGLIAAVIYSRNNRILFIKLRVGSRLKGYRYFEVPEAAYVGLLAAESPAKAFDELVKKPGYKYEQVVI